MCFQKINLETNKKNRYTSGLESPIFILLSASYAIEVGHVRLEINFVLHDLSLFFRISTWSYRTLSTLFT